MIFKKCHRCFKFNFLNQKFPVTHIYYTTHGDLKHFYQVSLPTTNFYHPSPTLKNIYHDLPTFILLLPIFIPASSNCYQLFPTFANFFPTFGTFTNILITFYYISLIFTNPANFGSTNASTKNVETKNVILISCL